MVYRVTAPASAKLVLLAKMISCTIYVPGYILQDKGTLGLYSAIVEDYLQYCCIPLNPSSQLAVSSYNNGNTVEDVKFAD